MSFNINAVLTDMLGAIKGSVEDSWDDVKGVADQFLQRKKARIEMMVELRINGELTQEEFDSSLSDEKLILEAELNALAVVSKAAVQKAANAAINVLSNAVNTAISNIL